MAKRVSISTFLVGAAAILAVAAVPAISGAAVKPGDFITAKTAYKVKGLVSPGVYWKVERGMAMKIVPTSSIQWPPPYRSATEKYASQVRLTPNHRSLIGYVAGQPFPFLDPNDPHVAVKIMWNNVFRPITTDDYDLRYYECQTQYVRPGEAQRIVNDVMVGHYAGYSEIGRTEVNPIPVDPDFKKTGRMWLFALYPVLSPENERGAGIIRWRYSNPEKNDASWSYQVSSRRVRRLNNAVLSDNTNSGGAWNPDHYSGFNPKTEWYNYKFLGDKSMLACVHAAHSPEITCPYDGGSSVCPEDWEMRRMYVVEALPRYGKDNAVQGRNVVYIDSEAWFEPYVDTYSQNGQLWENFLYYLAYRDRPVPDARIAIYPFKREFVVGAVSTDEQGATASVCYLPSRNSPEHECWYINMGAVNKSFCTPEAMRFAAQVGM